MSHNKTEQEAIALCVTLEAIDNIVNHSLLDYRPVKEFPGEAVVYFHDNIHRDLFLVRILDFTNEKGAKGLTGVEGSCINVIESICNSPSFSKSDSIQNLKNSVKRLREWLYKSKKVNLWLPTLDIDAFVNVSRLELLTISGNSSKHNISRLTGVCRIIHDILQRNGYTTDLDLMPLALEDFEDHLQGNYFIYYGTQLAELMNNLRWGIQDYLLPTFRECHKIGTEDRSDYSYAYPSDIVNNTARLWFWRLLNNVRRKPYFEKFKCEHCLNEESSLETIKTP